MAGAVQSVLRLHYEPVSSRPAPGNCGGFSAC